MRKGHLHLSCHWTRGGVGHAVWPLSPKQPKCLQKCMWWNAFQNISASGVIDPITVWPLKSYRPRCVFKNKCRRGLCHQLHQLILILIYLSILSVYTWLSVCLHACLPLCLPVSLRKLFFYLLFSVYYCLSISVWMENVIVLVWENRCGLICVYED